jgi:rubrerythrin
VHQQEQYATCTNRSSTPRAPTGAVTQLGKQGQSTKCKKGEGSMDLEKALATAIEYEEKVHAVYAKAAKEAKDPVAVKVYATMSEEEARHVAYLKSRLAEWKAHGHLAEERLESLVPSYEAVTRGVARLKEKAATLGQRRRDAEAELAYLQQALAVENETFAFYSRMVAETPPEARRLFERFLEIEKAHGAIVQAQIDAVTGLGFWFDLQEFSLESG